MDWQPIETAPHDVDVLVFQPSPPVVTVGMVDTDSIGYAYTQAAWRIRATHWMPLPEPPK